MLYEVITSKLINPEEAFLLLEEAEEEENHENEQPFAGSHLCQFLDEVEGLDCMTGMFYAMNDEQNYYRVLKASLEAVRSMTGKLKSFCSQTLLHGTGKIRSNAGKKQTEYGMEEVRLDRNNFV